MRCWENPRIDSSHFEVLCRLGGFLRTAIGLVERTQEQEGGS